MGQIWVPTVGSKRDTYAQCGPSCTVTMPADHPGRLPEMPDSPPGSCTLVLHGPEVFDAGDAVFLADRLHPARIIVSGVMGRTAAEESGILCEFISVPPSRVLCDLDGSAILVNHGKTPESGRIFGEIVASRLHPAGLIQLECSDRTLYVWNRPAGAFARYIANRTGYGIRVVASEEMPGPHERRIRGCVAGEPVYIDGIVIGHATGPEAVVRAVNGEIVVVSGLVPKSHGFEKISGRQYTDLSRVWCKSGQIRTGGPGRYRQRPATGRVLFLDHCGHQIYTKLTPDTCGIVSVGDDTTAVCGHVAAHLGIPVFGIIDGDGDGIVAGSFVTGSVIAHAVHERDDDIGDEIGGMIPDGVVAWDEFVEELIRHLGERVKVSNPGE